MLSKPKVSVIIPVYNVERYIVGCLRSVVEQNIDAAVEIILVDDCGTDSSVTIAKNYASSVNNPKREIRFLKHERNRGQAAARNTGVKEAKGEYLFFIDSDDSLPIDALSRLFAYTQNEDAEIIEGQSTHVNEMGEIIKTPDTTAEHFVSSDEIWNIGTAWMPVCWNKLISRKFYTEHNLWFEEGFYYEDLLWAYNVALSQPRIKIVSDATYNYLVRQGSTSNSMSKKHVDSFILMVQHLAKMYDQIGRMLASNKQAHAAYERFRSIAIDYVYSSCSKDLCKKLIKGLRGCNVESLWCLLRNQYVSRRLFTKILPLYMGNVGHYVIKSKSAISKRLK